MLLCAYFKWKEAEDRVGKKLENIEGWTEIGVEAAAKKDPMADTAINARCCARGAHEAAEDARSQPPLPRRRRSRAAKTSRAPRTRTRRWRRRGSRTAAATRRSRRGSRGTARCATATTERRRRGRLSKCARAARGRVLAVRARPRGAGRRSATPDAARRRAFPARPLSRPVSRVPPCKVCYESSRPRGARRPEARMLPPARRRSRARSFRPDVAEIHALVKHSARCHARARGCRPEIRFARRSCALLRRRSLDQRSRARVLVR